MYVCACVCTCVEGWVYVDIHVRCLPQLLFTLSFETVFLTGLEALQLSLDTLASKPQGSSYVPGPQLHAASFGFT